MFDERRSSRNSFSTRSCNFRLFNRDQTNYFEYFGQTRGTSFVSIFFLAREWNNKNLPARFFLPPPPLPSTINLNWAIVSANRWISSETNCNTNHKAKGVKRYRVTLIEPECKWGNGKHGSRKFNDWIDPLVTERTLSAIINERRAVLACR